MEELKQSLLRVKNLASQLEIILSRLSNDPQNKILSKNRQPGFYEENAIFFYIEKMLKAVAEGQSPKIPLFFYDTSSEFNYTQLEEVLKIKLEQAKKIEKQFVENNKQFMNLTIKAIESLHK